LKNISRKINQLKLHLTHQRVIQLDWILLTETI